MTDAVFEELYDHAPCGLLSTTFEGRVLEVNATFLEWTGYERSAVVGHALDDLLTAGSRLFAETRYRPTLRLEGEVREVALTFRTADDATLPVLVNAVLRAAGDEPTVRVAVFGSAGRHDYERELLEARRAAERSEARVRVLQDLSNRLAGSASPDDVASALSDAAARALDATDAAVMLLRGGVLQWAGGSDATGSFAVTGPEEEALRTREPVALGSLEEAEAAHPGLGEALRAARIEAMCVTPLLEDGQPDGVLTCFFRRGREFPADVLKLQAALCRQAVQALQRVRLQERLRERALRDPLTGLPNRTLLESRLMDALADSDVSGRPMALVFVDLDGFKAVNDRLGHHAGDRVLETVADRLTSIVRRSDTVGRLGGDEFMIICADADTRTAERVGERVAEAVRAPLEGLPADLRLTASIGIATHVPGGGITPDRISRAADAAMYAAKHAGKDRTAVVAATSAPERTG